MHLISSRAVTTALALVSSTLLGATVASAHVSLASGPAPAGKSSKVSFGVGHGCDHDDTRKVRATTPAGVTSVRPLRSDFGTPTVIKEGDVVVAVEWEKPAAELLEADEAYYELTIRMRPQPGGTGNTAPVLLVVPSRVAGWNKYTVPAAMSEDLMPTFFGDAQIVWRGNAAYSPNALVAAVIATTPGVVALTGGLAADDEIWVKY